MRWGMFLPGRAAAFANLSTTLARGMLDVGVDEIDLIVRKNKIVSSFGHLPKQVRVVNLQGRRARTAFVSLARYIREYRPEALISMPAFMNPSAIVAKVLAGGNTILVVSEHATMSYKAYVEHRGDWRFRALPTLARLLYPLADGVVCVSDAVLADLVGTVRISLRPERRAVIHNPIDRERIARLATEDPDHPWLLQKDRPVILSIGRLVRQKNHALLLHSFARIRRRVSARLIILGEGPLRDSLEVLARDLSIADAVSIPGFQPNPYAFLSRADVFALSSEEEGFGLVLGEAMACGCPIVSVDCPGGPREILDSEKCGILVPPDDPELLSRAILRILVDRELRQGFIRAGYKRLDDFTPAGKAKEYLDFIHRLQELRQRRK